MPLGSETHPPPAGPDPGPPGPNRPGPDASAQQSRAGQRATWVAAGVNVLLMGCKFGAGLLGNSQALIADAVHSLSDLFTDLVVLFGLRAGRKGPDTDHHFGHARIETMASAVVGLALLAVAVYLGYGAALSIYHHTERHPTWLAVAAAALSIAVKESLYHYTVRVGRRIKSPALVANAWHQRSDALSSVAVLLGVAGAQIKPGWHILDAYAALLVSFFIVKVGLEVLWGSLREMVDTAPGAEVLDRVRSCVRRVPGVLEEHDLKIRSSGGLYQMQVHILVDGDLSVSQGHRIAKEVERCLYSDIEDVGQVIVHVDPAEAAGDG